MLRLASTTPPAWVAHVETDVPALLTDHAHCEKKAASTAINLIFRYPDKLPLVRAMTALAREELEHFDRLLDVLDHRGTPYARLAPSPYAPALLAEARSDEPHRLADTLLCCALIEARSCERMKVLADHLSDPDLQSLYADLLASEARHFRTYVALARALVPAVDVDARLAALADHEAAVLDAPAGPVRMHGTFPAAPTDGRP